MVCRVRNSAHGIRGVLPATKDSRSAPIEAPFPPDADSSAGRLEAPAAAAGKRFVRLKPRALAPIAPLAPLEVDRDVGEGRGEMGGGGRGPLWARLEELWSLPNGASMAEAERDTTPANTWVRAQKAAV